MIAYILRRLLLMIPTLFGITVMVFLIARLAPGRPGTQQVGDSGMSAEEQKALREWYDKRYGLDLPLWQQYARWWKSMFTAEAQALAWTDEPEPRPVYTLWRSEPERYARMPDGSWRLVKSYEVVETHAQNDPAAAALASSEASTVRDALPKWNAESGYIVPRHALAEASLVPLDEEFDLDLLEPVRRTDLPRVAETAPAFGVVGDEAGEPLYVGPAGGESFLVRRGGEWLRFVERSRSILTVDDKSLPRLLGRHFDTLPEARGEYALPRVALLRGGVEPLDAPPSNGEPAPARVPIEIAVPTMVWARAGDARMASGAVAWAPLYQQKEPAPVLVVEHGQGGWERLLGPTRIERPDFRLYEQSDPVLQARLGGRLNDIAVGPAVGGVERERRHALLETRAEPVDAPIAARDVRRYSQPVELVEVTLGQSRTSHAPVMEELKRRLPITLLISLVAFPMIYAIAIPCGMLMAVKRGKWLDASANFVFLALWSIPTVLAGTLMIGYLCQGGLGPEWFPNNSLSSVGSERAAFSAWLFDRLWHLVLPVTCIVYGGFAYLAKQMRASMLDNFTMDYVRTARAKGVPFKDIVLRHVLRNSLLPLITIFATILPVLIAGSIIIEKIFNIEGMGLFTFRAVQNRDYDVVQATALIAGVLNLVGLLLADICYAVADPRITYK